MIVPREVRVLVVDGAPSPVRYRDEAYFVESALASPASPVRPTVVDAEALAGQDLSRFDVVFLLNVRAPGARAADLARFVEQGGGLFVALGDQIEPEEYGKQLAGLLPAPLHVVKTAPEGRPARFGEVDASHPALSVFQGEAREGLLGVRTTRWVLAKPGAAGARDGQRTRVVASFDDGAPALLESRRGKGRVLLFTSSADRDWTDWPIRTSFLPAMQRFAAWLAGGLDDRRDPPAKPGEARAIRLEPGEELVALVGPDGRERRRTELERAGLREEGGCRASRRASRGSGRSRSPRAGPSGSSRGSPSRSRSTRASRTPGASARRSSPPGWAAPRTPGWRGTPGPRAVAPRSRSGPSCWSSASPPSSSRGSSSRDHSRFDCEVAGLFCVGFQGKSPSPEVKELVRRGVHGVILFARNVEDAEQVAALVAELKRLAGVRSSSRLTRRAAGSRG